MVKSLVLLRFIGGFFGTILILWAFSRFRSHLIRRNEFMFTSLFGTALIIVSVMPDSINIVAGMLSLENRQFGRLITLLLLSNLMIWMLVFSLRSKDLRKSIQLDLLIRKLAREKFIEKAGLDRINEIMVIIPALDEAENLCWILPRVPTNIKGRTVGILVVDDGSTDDTVAVVRNRGYLIVSNPINRGGGAALRLGFDIAMAGGAEMIITMDGDGQHLPEEIERLVDPILQDQADFVIGSRVLGQRERDSTLRWVGIHVFNFIINMLAGTRITDCSNGFRAFRVASLKKLLLLQDQFHTAELIIDAARKGIRIIDVPVTVLRRHAGQSKKGRNWSYGINFSKTILKTWLRK